MNTQKDEMNHIKEISSDNEVSITVMEGQVARRIVDLLDDRAQALTATEIARLSAARSMAVKHLAGLQAQAITHSRINQNGNVLQWFGHHRAASVAMVIGALLIGLFVVQHLGVNHNLEHGDAFLLASDLPPEAYADKGFNTWVDSN